MQAPANEAQAQAQDLPPPPDPNHTAPIAPPEPTILQKLQTWINQTDHTLGSFLDSLRRTFDIPPKAAAAAIVVAVFVYMMCQPEHGQLISQLICCGTYPLEGSIAALAVRDADQIRMWSMYWFLVANVRGLDFLANVAAIYWPLKTAAMAYLFLPPTLYMRTINEQWASPVIELVLAQLTLDTVRKAHPFLLRMLRLDDETLGRINQEQLDAHLVQCHQMFAAFMQWLNNQLGQVMSGQDHAADHQPQGQQQQQQQQPHLELQGDIPLD